MRVVLDTNVLVSGLLNKRGPPGQILDAWRNRRFDLVACAALVDEFKRVCAYPKLAPYILPGDIGTLVNRLHGAECWLAAIPRVDLSVDTDDNYLLAMALAAEADYLVSGDGAGLLRIGNQGRTQIVTAGTFVMNLK